MTTNIHANTVRENMDRIEQILAQCVSADEWGPEASRIRAAVDALQAQAETNAGAKHVRETLIAEADMQRERAEAAEAERDRWKEMHALASNDWSAEKDRREAAEAERDKLQRRWELLKTGYDKAEAERDRLAKVLRRIAKSDMGWAGKTAQAALAHTEHTPPECNHSIIEIDHANDTASCAKCGAKL